MKQKLFFNQIGEVKKAIDSGISTSVIGLPGVGITLFLKHLSREDFADFIIIDVFSLPVISKVSLFDALDKNLNNSQKGRKKVIIITGFDHLKDSFDIEFFNKLKEIKNRDRENIVFIFGICKRIETFFPDDNLDIDFTMFGNLYFLKPFNKNDTHELLKIYNPNLMDSDANLNLKIEQSGGHFQILQLLLQDGENSSSKFVELALKNIYNHLSYKQRKQIEKIALNKHIDDVDMYLIDIGLIIKKGENYEFFTPLFSDFVKKQSSKLPIKERALLRSLIEKKGEIISKDELFSDIWGEEDDYPSDWALDALIYRLRNNPVFKSKGYTIENLKKQGYRLVD